MSAEVVYDAALLAARAEITEVIHLFCHALDRHRWELMDQVFHADATVKYSFRPMTQSYADWVAAARVTMSAFPATLHQIGNVLIDVDGETAWTESYVTAIHRVPIDASKTAFWDGRSEPYDGTGAGRYIDRFEHRDGRWKIAAREALIEWRHDAPARDGALAELPRDARGQRGDTDISRPVIAHRLAQLARG